LSGELLQLPLRAGLDEGTDPKQLPPGTLLEGINVRQDKSGRVRKRFGTTRRAMLDTASAAVAGKRIIRQGKALEVTDGVDVLPRTTEGTWSRVDRLPSLASTEHPLADTTRTTGQASCAIAGSLRISVFSTALTGYSAPGAGSIYVQIENYETGALIMRPTLIDDNAKYPRVFSDGASTAYVGYVTAAGDLKVTSVDLVTLTLGTPATIVAGNVGIWDGVLEAPSMLFLAFDDAIAGMRVAKYDIVAVSYTSATIAGPDTYTAVAIDTTGGTYVRTLYSTTTPATTISTRAHSNLAAVAGPTDILAREGQSLAVIGIGGGRMLTLFTWINATTFALSTESRIIDDVTHSPDSSVGDELSQHVAVASRIFIISGRYYFLGTVAVIPPAIATSNDVTVSPHSALVFELNPAADDTDSQQLHRRMATLEARTSALQLNVVTQPATDSDGRVHLAIARKQREPVGTEALPLTAVVHVLEERGEDWGASLAVGDSALCVASSPFLVDGPSAYAYGFAHEPDIVAAAPGGGGSGSMGAGTYIYCCVYEWRDAHGVFHRSAPSTPFTVSGVVATGSVALKIAQTSVDAKQSIHTSLGTDGASPVRIAIYRSTAGGSVLYRLTHEPSYNVLFNDPLNPTKTFTDTRADADIAGGSPTIRLDSRPEVYTAQELADINPGAATTGAVHRNRAWLISADRRFLQFSKKFDEDPSLAPGFNEEFVLLFTNDKYALASLDDKLVVLGDLIEVVFGDGPASDGSGIDWQIQRIATDTSCRVPRSVAIIPPGLIFRSPRGFELLDRGLNVTYIGKQVEDTLATYPIVTSAVVVAAEQEVRFTCTAEDGLTGVVLVLNYAYRAWYTRKYWNGVDAFTAAFVDAALIDDVYTLLASDGTILQETTAHHYDDDGSARYVSERISVPVYPTGAGGWHRLRAVQVVGESKSNHQLHLEASRDFASSAEQTKVFADGSLTTTVGPLEQARMTLRNQKRQAAVITVYDAAPANLVDNPIGTGEGPILSMLDVYFEPKEGPAKLAAAKKG
jgi:hypothetical protein